MRRALLTLATLLLMAPAFTLTAADKTFTPDTIHSRIGFTAKTLFKVEGNFKRYSMDISGDPDSFGHASIRVEIDPASINTENKTRDNHLRSDAFFNVAKFPRITFSSAKIWKQGGQVMVQGFLDMHGVVKEVTLAFNPSFGKNGAGNDTWSYEASLQINRNDWGVGSDDIAAQIGLKDTVELNLQLVGFFHEKEMPKPAPVVKKTPKKKAA